MAMTKAEQARMAELEEALRMARAMRWPGYPAPAPMTQADIKANLVEGGIKWNQPQMVARGWFAHTGSNPGVSYGCSDGTNHNSDGSTTSTQQMGRMFFTEREAWRMVRVSLTEKFAKELARVDAQIAALRQDKNGPGT